MDDTPLPTANAPESEATDKPTQVHSDNLQLETSPPKTTTTSNDSSQLSPLIKSTHMSSYLGRRVRVVGHILEVREDQSFVLMQSSDGSEIKLVYEADWDLWGKPTRYIEALGTVTDAQTIKLELFIPLGDNLDLQTVNATIDIIHDPRFRQVFFPQSG
ncbi:hypothetical protein VNI00_018624 [Paramarasmius palmivorus]|uniref:Replication factor A protein 3 n=1 Tax=Paramarasmius palmivorus TaxID=297713 RepID=A0AAW0AVJ9_9AGAR